VPSYLPVMADASMIKRNVQQKGAPTSVAEPRFEPQLDQLNEHGRFMQEDVNKITEADLTLWRKDFITVADLIRPTGAGLSTEGRPGGTAADSAYDPAGAGPGAELRVGEPVGAAAVAQEAQRTPTTAQLRAAQQWPAVQQAHDWWAKLRKEQRLDLSAMGTIRKQQYLLYLATEEQWVIEGNSIGWTGAFPDYKFLNPAHLREAPGTESEQSELTAEQMVDLTDGTLMSLVHNSYKEVTILGNYTNVLEPWFSGKQTEFQTGSKSLNELIEKANCYYLTQ